jgi:DNA-binding transcriptional regulator GbsR (MarR family)
MNETLTHAREHFIQGMSRIANFWGFPKAMGAIYGAIYLSREPLSLDELVQQANVSKGAVSTNVRHLERLGMVHKHIVVGERKDYYSAETDFWKIVKGILNEREKSEFDHALNAVAESLALLENDHTETALFYKKRMGLMQAFFKTLDSIVRAALRMESLIALSGLTRILEESEGDPE